MIIYDLQTTYIITSLVTVHNPNVNLTSAPISVDEDILLVENDIKKLASCGFSLKKFNNRGLAKIP